jgi:hypothetical protein
MKDPLESLLQGGAQRPGDAPAEVAARLAQEPEAISRMPVLLGGADPRVRGGAAEALALFAETDPDAVAPFVADLVAALDFEEIHTREQAGARWPLWPSAASGWRRVRPDPPGAFDPANPTIRRYAALAIARFGAGDPERARRAFPHLAEALRRFHDRPRSADILGAIALLARGGADAWLKGEIWKSARKHERHPDPAMRQLVEEIGALVR